MMWTDTHAHLDEALTAGDVEDVISRASACGVLQIVAVGGSPEANENAMVLSARYPDRVAAAIGYDRALADRSPPLGPLRAALAEGRAVAVGETGLDYHRETASRDAQRTLFEIMLELAAEFRRPVIVHTREAERDTREMLEAFVRGADPALQGPGVVHCFTGDWPFARALLDLGFYLGISGIVTFHNAEVMRDVVRRAPADRLLMETDCPYLTPVPHRGRRNEPAFLPFIGVFVAHLRNCSPENWARQTTDNAHRLFGVSTFAMRQSP